VLWIIVPPSEPVEDFHGRGEIQKIDRRHNRRATRPKLFRELVQEVVVEAQIQTLGSESATTCTQ